MTMIEVLPPSGVDSGTTRISRCLNGHASHGVFSFKAPAAQDFSFSYSFLFHRFFHGDSLFSLQPQRHSVYIHLVRCRYRGTTTTVGYSPFFRAYREKQQSALEANVSVPHTGKMHYGTYAGVYRRGSWFMQKLEVRLISGSIIFYLFGETEQLIFLNIFNLITDYVIVWRSCQGSVCCNCRACNLFD